VAPIPRYGFSSCTPRGGGWNNPADNLQAANRNRNPARNRNDDIGFRVAVAPANTLARAHVPMPPCRSLPGAVCRNLRARPFW